MNDLERIALPVSDDSGDDSAMKVAANVSSNRAVGNTIHRNGVLDGG